MAPLNTQTCFNGVSFRKFASQNEMPTVAESLRTVHAADDYPAPVVALSPLSKHINQHACGMSSDSEDKKEKTHRFATAHSNAGKHNALDDSLQQNTGTDPTNPVFELPAQYDNSPAIVIGDPTLTMVNEFISTSERKKGRFWRFIVGVFTCGVL